MSDALTDIARGASWARTYDVVVRKVLLLLWHFGHNGWHKNILLEDPEAEIKEVIGRLKNLKATRGYWATYPDLTSLASFAEAVQKEIRNLKKASNKYEEDKIRLEITANLGAILGGLLGRKIVTDFLQADLLERTFKGEISSVYLERLLKEAAELSGVKLKKRG